MPVMASIECLKMMREKEFYESLNALSYKFYDEFNALFKEFGIPGHVKEGGPRFATYFGIDDEENNYSLRTISAKFDNDLYPDFVNKSQEPSTYFHARGWSGGVARHP